MGGIPIFAVWDFILFTFGGWPWPVFNFADVFLVTGAVMLVLQSFRGEQKNEHSTAEENAQVTVQAGKDVPSVK